LSASVASDAEFWYKHNLSPIELIDRLKNGTVLNEKLQNMVSTNGYISIGKCFEYLNENY